MAENVRETSPPEPPPKPPEVPKPTEQPNRSEAEGRGQQVQSQQSAQQDARNAARAEHAKATDRRELDGSRPTAQFQARQDEHPAADNEPQGLLPGTANASEETTTGIAADAKSGPDGPVDHDDAKIPTEIADEIASSLVDVRTKPHNNSAGDTVDRYILDDVEDLLPLAEHLGIGELSHDKDDYYSGQLPDGRYRKIEWNMKGHPETNEGPHVKVMETADPWSPPSKGGNRWKTKAMIFVEGHEQFKRQWY